MSQNQFARNAKLREEYEKLRIQNVPAKDIYEFLAGETGLSVGTIKKNVHSKDKQPRELPEEPLKEIPDAFATSTLYDAEGNKKLVWVKEKKDKGVEIAREMAEALAETLPKVKASEPRSKKFRSDTLAVYPMGDPHFGLYAWADEAGEDFDLKIAERNLCAAVDRLVDTVPACESALIVNVGDFFHADNMEGRTARSGHVLDTDSRWRKVLGVGVKAMRQCIESALRKHNHVTVINAIGNHDDHSSMFLSVLLKNLYENEPRVTINDAPTILHFHEFGANMVAVTHGHSIKMDKLPLVAASEKPEMWGRTRHRWGVTGHVHTDNAKEFNGMKVESFRTLAGRNAWEASQGYKAKRDMKAILLHAAFGEVERHTVNVEMLDV